MDQEKTDYEKQLKNVTTTFSLASQEYERSFPNAKIFKDSTTYQRPFRQAKQSLSSANADLFELDAVVNTKIDKHMREVERVNKQIDRLKKENEALTVELETIKSSDKAAMGRYANSRQDSYLQLYTGLTLCGVSALTYLYMKHRL